MNTTGRASIEWARFALVTLELVVAVAAVGGGLLLLVEPSGRLIGMSTAALQGSRFPNYLVPGLFLLVVIGGGLFAAMLAQLRRQRTAALGSVAAGVGLVGWIAVQVAIIGFLHPLQAIVFFFGIAIVILSLIDARGRSSAWE
jgi:hypothetical protein